MLYSFDTVATLKTLGISGCPFINNSLPANVSTWVIEKGRTQQTNIRTGNKSAELQRLEMYRQQYEKEDGTGCSPRSFLSIILSRLLVSAAEMLKGSELTTPIVVRCSLFVTL